MLVVLGEVFWVQSEMAFGHLVGSFSSISIFLFCAGLDDFLSSILIEFGYQMFLHCLDLVLTSLIDDTNTLAKAEEVFFKFLVFGEFALMLEFLYQFIVDFSFFFADFFVCLEFFFFFFS